MFAYSEDGQHFLGFRTNAVGKMQIVYEALSDKTSLRRAGWSRSLSV